ncbi:MAG: metalloregulator ArsR/SmtB family transcription factor [Clostridiales bacterium]|nr:metalloregulator ArsR/SmtB family transcription factor [Clostridiales bacterium]
MNMVLNNNSVEKTMLNAIKQEMPDINTLFSLAELYKVFGDTTRIRIMCALFNRELCVFDIAEIIEMGQSAVSHQLRILRSAHLVKVRKDGKQSYYSLDDDHVKEIFHLGLEHITEEK